VAQAKGLHPITALMDYDIISGRPSKTAKAIMRDFLGAGGKVEWHEWNDQRCDATFSHPQGGTIRVDWDMERAKTAGLLKNEMYKKFPRNMLKARCISDGVGMVYSEAMDGMYTPEEVADFEPLPKDQPLPPTKQVRDVAPAKTIPSRSTEATKNEWVSTSLNDALAELAEAATLADLKVCYRAAHAVAKGWPDVIEKLTAAKDKRKLELEAANEPQDEPGQVPSENLEPQVKGAGGDWK
jgi:hypothetical protein